MAFFLWGLLSLGLAGALVFSSQLEFLVPAVAAIVVLALSFLPGMEQNYLLQTVIWLILSAGGLVLFRDRLRRLKTPRNQRVEDSIAGKRAVVTEAIGEGPGRVRFQGTTWTAVAAQPLAVGVEVVVLGQDGLVLQVEQPEQDRMEAELKALEGGGTEWK